MPSAREARSSLLACRRRAKLQSLFYKGKNGAAAQGQTARRPAPHAPSPCRPLRWPACSMPPSRSLNRRLWAAGGCSETPGPRSGGAPGRTGRREKQVADCKRASSGAYRVPVGAGPSLRAAGRPGTPAAGWWRAGSGSSGPAAGRPQPERDGVARVLGGHPTRDEGESGPAATPPSEGS